jgi:ribosomal protein S18 acetylase RimI-like enzyme
MFSFCKAADTPSPEGLATHALPWIMEAGNPYYNALFGDAGATLSYLQKWVCRASSEVSILRVEFLVSDSTSDSEFAGGFIALSGGDLRKARRADGVALLTSIAAQDRAALAQRLNNLSDLMAPVGDDEYYLSKVGLAQQFRGKGLARKLVGRYIEEGARLGYSRYRLDVSADNEAAVRCYRSAGFEIARSGQSQDGALKYYSMTYEGARS